MVSSKANRNEPNARQHIHGSGRDAFFWQSRPDGPGRIYPALGRLHPNGRRMSLLACVLRNCQEPVLVESDSGRRIYSYI